MIEGYEYQHYKGGMYEFLGIALPYNESAIENFNMGTPYFVWDALTPDGAEFIEIKVWEKNGVLICDSELPQVIYRSFADYDDERGREYYDYWGRTVNDFFSDVPYLEGFDVKMRKRFSLCIDKNLSNPYKLEYSEMVGA